MENWNNNYQYNNYNQNFNNSYVQPPNNKKNKVKRKKKHRFLKFLLLCIAIFILYKLSSIGLGKLAMNDLEKFAIDYPFTFEEKTDSLWYVTNNITVPNTYVYKDKIYTVEWTTNNKAISVSKIDDTMSRIEIKRPNIESIKVDLIETYKKLWGKAEKRYTITLIPTSTMNQPEIIDLDTYNRDMQVVYDENDNLKYMLGDFKNIYINSKEDALLLLETYKTQFIKDENIINNISFKFVDIVKIGIYNTYKFDVYINDIRLEYASATVSINNSDNSLTKISIDIEDYENIINTDEVISKEDINKNIPLYITQINGQENIDYIICTSSEIYSDDKLCYIYEISLENGDAYQLKINAKTGELIDYQSQLSNSEIDTRKFTDIIGKAQNEAGKDIEFNATRIDKKFLFSNKEEYILQDLTRNIHAYDNEGWWGLFKEAEKSAEKENGNVLDVLTVIGGLADYAIETQLKYEIKSDTNVFTDSQAAQAFDHMQTVYDWYKNTFDLSSFNGKGKEVVIRVHTKNDTDNACWDGQSKTFVINPSKNLKYSVGMYLEVLGHEYTHAVFHYAGAELSGGEEVKGLNEAYADIMGIIISQDSSWQVCNNYTIEGENGVFRDLANINSDLVIYDRKYPEVYYGENWTGEEHNICPIIGHIAYEMYANGGFSWNDLAKIWYNSLGLCYDSSSTYVTCRKYIIQTAEDLGYSDEKIDFIAKAFDDREIFDPSYEFKTDKSSDGLRTKKIKSNAVKGDSILDDTNPHKFLIVCSPIGSALGKSGIVIYEEVDGKKLSTEKQNEISQTIQSKLTSNTNQISELSDTEFEIPITYKQISKTEMSFLERFCKNSVNKIKNYTYTQIQNQDSLTDEEFEEAKGWLDILFELCLYMQITYETPYDFYNSFGIIE